MWLPVLVQIDKCRALRENGHAQFPAIRTVDKWELTKQENKTASIKFRPRINIRKQQTNHKRNEL